MVPGGLLLLSSEGKALLEKKTRIPYHVQPVITCKILLLPGPRETSIRQRKTDEWGGGGDKNETEKGWKGRPKLLSFFITPLLVLPTVLSSF